MRKLALAILIITTVISANAQKRFEMDVTGKMGYYFAANKTNFPEMFFPENVFSPGAGIAFGYTFFKSTGVFVGMEYSHLHPKMIDYFGTELDVKWQSFNVPLIVEQGIGENFFLTGGVIMVRQLKGYYDGLSAFAPQKIPEYNWQIGTGYKFKDLRISVQFQRGFESINKKIKVSENEYFTVTV
jgi:hypothetical protein